MVGGDARAHFSKGSVLTLIYYNHLLKYKTFFGVILRIKSHILEKISMFVVLIGKV